jgi:hypothetical protein
MKPQVSNLGPMWRLSRILNQSTLLLNTRDGGLLGRLGGRRNAAGAQRGDTGLTRATNTNPGDMATEGPGGILRRGSLRGGVAAGGARIGGRGRTRGMVPVAGGRQ